MDIVIDNDVSDESSPMVELVESSANSQPIHNNDVEMLMQMLNLRKLKLLKQWLWEKEA